MKRDKKESNPHPGQSAGVERTKGRQQGWEGRMKAPGPGEAGNCVYRKEGGVRRRQREVPHLLLSL